MTKKKKEQIIPEINMPKNQEDWKKRILIFTPTMGQVRMEWVGARFGQIIPTNWSHVDMKQFLSPYVPLKYQLADAQNLMAKKVIEDDYEWIIYIEDDNVIPQDTFVRFNKYINEGEVPVVSGVYFTKAEPTEPILYRGRGNSYFQDWKMGDKVWVDGIPFGCRLENASLIKAAWKESPEYMVGNELTRRVFEQPEKIWFDEEKGAYAAKVGTTDLAWCTRIMEDNLFEKAGWEKYQKMKNPFLVDTEILVGHITPEGKMFPFGGVPKQFIRAEGEKPKEVK